MSDTATTLHLVRARQEWELKPFWHGVWYYRAPKKGGAVRAFSSAKRAAKFLAKLEQHARAKLPKVNPFLLCRDWEMNYEIVTTMPEFALLDWIRDVGLVAPVPHPRAPREQLVTIDWYQWWNTNVKSMTPEQLHHLWTGLDRVRFYEVVAVELE